VIGGQYRVERGEGKAIISCEKIGEEGQRKKSGRASKRLHAQNSGDKFSVMVARGGRKGG